MPDTFLQSLSCPLPEDIAHLKGAGEYELALRLIDRRLAGQLPAMLRARLEAERLFLQRLPRAYTLTEADAVAEMRRSVPDFTAQEWQEYLLDGKLDFIYLNGQRLYHEDTCASLLKTQRALNARALAPYDEQKPRLEAVLRQVMAGGRAYRFRLRAVTSIADDVFAPDTRYRIHLPIPAQSMQQSAAEELRATLPILYTDAADAPQRTAYMELCAHENAPIVTEYAWTQRPRYVNPLDETARGPVYPDARPVQAEDLAEQPPHICFTPYLRSLAAELRGSETDPVRIARRFYDFITTRVMYALTTPTTESMRGGPTPVPVQAPPAVGLEEVTKG